MSEPYRLMILVTTALMLLSLIWSRREIRRDWNHSTTVVLAVAWLINVRHVAAVARGDYYLASDGPYTSTFTVVYGPTADIAYRLALSMIVVLGGSYVAHTALKRRCWNPPATVAILLLSWVLLSTYWNAGPLNPLQAGTMMVILLLAGVLAPGAGARLGAALFGISVLVVSALLMLIREDGATRPCGINKCGPLGVLYTGVFQNENSLGLTLAVTLPFILAAFQGRRLFILVVALGFAVLATESRTAQLAVAVTLLVYLIARARGHREVIGAAAVTAGFVALVVPFVAASSTATAFTGRPALWFLAIERWQEQWFLGYGSQGWSGIRERSIEVGAEASYSPHNQWLDLLHSGGIVGAMLFLALVVTMYRSAAVSHRSHVGLLLVAVMTIGIVERAWGTSGPDWLYWSLLAACLAGGPDRAAAAVDDRSVSPAEGASSQARSRRWRTDR